MAFRGRKVADIYAELHLDRDSAQDTLRGIPGALGADADRAGQDLGKKLTDGLAKAVEQSSARLAKAKRAEVEATKAVELAELRLNEARKKGVSEGTSRMLALTNALEKAQYRQTQASSAATAATVKLGDAQKRLAVAMDDIGRNAGPSAERAGRDLGSKLSQGIHLSIVRNSPLIAAAVGAGLIAGAPLVLAGATGLFAGIGIVSAAQSESVKSAWKATWEDVKTGAISDAKLIEPVLVRLADRVGAAFERQRPVLRGIFADAAPQIEVFAGGLIGLTERVLPGFERAVARGMPVTEGLADFLEKTGSGLTGFLDNISEHAPAAGEAFSLIGDVLVQLLPLTGELLGQGAELATMVLPPLVSVLRGVSAAADMAGGALPAVTAALIGMKVASLVGDGIGKIGDRLVTAADGGGRFSRSMGGVGSALQSVNSAAGTAGLSAVLVGLISYFSKVDATSSKWASSLREGGQAAENARTQMADWGAAQREVTSGVDGGIISLIGFGATMGATAQAVDGVNEKLREQWQAMDPLAQAQSKVAEWSATLRDRMLDESSSTADVEAAKRRLAHWQEEAARLADKEAMAHQGVTEALVAETQAIYGRADADLAFRNAVDAQEDALATLNEAVREHGAASEEADDAGRRWEGTLNDQVGAARRLAEEALPAAMEANQKKALSDFAALDALRQLEAQYGDALPPAIRAQIPALEAATASYDRGRLEASKMSAELDVLGGKRPQPIAMLNSDPFTMVADWTMQRVQQLAGQRPTPVAGMNNAPFASVAQWTAARIAGIGAMSVFPSATLVAYTAAAEAAINRAARARTVAITAVARIVPGGATGGKVSDIAARGFADGGTPRRRSDGKLLGPGGPLDDLIPAVTETGERIRVATREWIVNGFVSAQQGDQRMALLNAGKADIVPRRRSSAGSVASMASHPASDVQAGAGAGTTITVQGGIHVHVHTPLNLMNSRDLDRAAQAIDERLVVLQRRRS